MQASLASRFSRAASITHSVGNQPLREDQMRAAAPSIFAESKHGSRSERYTYIPTIEVLRGLQKEGFEPFMVAQSGTRIAGKAEFTKHMIRMRHAGQVQNKPEANEVILINSHDGASSYQMLAGVFRFVCCNGLIVGDVASDIRFPHKGDILGEVIDGACRVLDEFTMVNDATESMKAITLRESEQLAFAAGALALRFDQPVAPVTARQLNEPRRIEDTGNSLWTTLQRVQENVVRGGQPGRTALGRRMRTRAVEGIDRGVAVNRALWTLAEEMQRIKAAA